MNEETKNRIAAINSGIIPEGYKKTKVGIVPVEWDRYKLSDISDELTEKAGNNPYETLSISAGIGFVNQANKFGKELSGKQYEKYIVLHKGDFSYNKGNSKKYPQGCIYQLKDRDEAAVPNVFESFRLNKGINDYYEQLFVSGFLNRQLFAKINHGVRDDGLLNLKGEDFYSCYVPSPPLPEQQKIAEILSTQDKLIELQEKKIEQLKELKKAYLQKMFPKKGSKYPELRFKGFTDPWEQRKFSDFTFAAGERNKDDLDLEPFAITNNQGFIAQSEAHDDFGYMKDVDRKMYIVVKPNSFAYNPARINVGSLGYYEGAENVIVSSLYEVFQTAEYVDDKFLKHWFKTKAFQDWIERLQEGSVRLYFYYDKLCECIMSMPSVEEQRKIGAYLDKIDNLITLHQRKSEQEKQKKKALMQLLLTGKMRCK